MSPARYKLIETDQHDHHQTAFHKERKDRHKCCVLGVLAIAVLIASIIAISVIYHPS